MEIKKTATYIQLTLHIDSDSSLFNKLVTLQRLSDLILQALHQTTRGGAPVIVFQFCQVYKAYEQITDNGHVARAIYMNGKVDGLVLSLHGRYL